MLSTFVAAVAAERRRVLNHVYAEVAALRVVVACLRLKQAAALEVRFNPYHDEAGRFTTAEGAVEPGGSRDGRVRVAQVGDGENLRARIGGNGPPLEGGTLLGRFGAIADRYVFGPLGTLISMTESIGNGELLRSFDGGKTEGILESAEGDFYLKSGWAGPANEIVRGTSGFNIVTRTHVEGHAAALMRNYGLSEARVYLSNPVICESCVSLLPRMLPPGAKLEVVTPLGARTFAGRILP